MTKNEVKQLSYDIIGYAIRVHKHLGPGLLESPIHEAQILTYMKLLNAPQGLLVKFFTDNITKSLKPFVNEYYKILPD